MELSKTEEWGEQWGRIMRGGKWVRGGQRRWKGLVKSSVLESCWAGDQEEGVGELAERLGETLEFIKTKRQGGPRKLIKDCI